MDNKFSFGEKLDFNDIDLTEPDKVIQVILSELSRETNGIILGKIQPYSGQIFSYRKVGIPGILEAFDGGDRMVDVQDQLGEIGREIHKFECYLYTPEYDKYKFRVFFIQYDIANYPVDVVLDESVSRSISDSSYGYVYTCNTRDELESLIYRIFNSKRIVAVMQELIRINQAKRIAKANLETDASDGAE